MNRWNERRTVFHAGYFSPSASLIKWSTSERPEDLACAASAGKGAKAGLLKDLSNEDCKLFDVAKDAELTSCWLQASALKPQIPRGTILETSWGS